MMGRKRHAAGIIVRMLILAVWAAAIGCAGGTDVGNPETNTFSSDTALKDYLVSQYARSAGPIARQSFADDAPPGMTEPGAGWEMSGDMDISAWGMDADAPDRVVSGNGCLYVAGETDVRIISAARPEAMRFVGRITVEGRVDALHLSGQRLVVLYSPEGGKEAPQGNPESSLEMINKSLPGVLFPGTGVGILVADVSTPGDPVIIKHIRADGYRLASRMSGGCLHVAVRFMPVLPPLQLWHDGTESGAAEAEDYNAHALADLTIDDLTPSYTAFDDFENPVAQGRLVATNAYIRPIEPGGGAILAIITINPHVPGSDFSSIGLIADIHHVHVSSDAFYLLAMVFNDDTADIYETRIHRIDIANDSAQYTAHGRVRGRLLDPSAVGQYQDIFRISTITGLFRDDTAAGHVFCLKRENDALAIIGRLENLFPGRTPGTVRLIGPMGFIMNAEDVNLITMLDLADPASPKTSGMLESQGAPVGFFPVFDDLLMVITGNACKVEGSSNPTPGICLRLFDISDTSAPRLRHSETINGSDTDDSIVFRLSAPPVFRPDDRLLAVPVAIGYNRQFPDPSGEIDPYVFSGIYIYELTDENALARRGILEMWPGTVGEEDNPPIWIRGLLTDDAVYAAGPDRVSAGGIGRVGDGFEIHSRFTLPLTE
jgi:hypothetical protein